LDMTEYTVFQKLLQEYELSAALNAKPAQPMEIIELPKYYRRRIISDDIFPRRKHPDIRVVRRASTIANLARVISERKVQAGLRRTVLTQARRLEMLAKQRLSEYSEE